MDYSTERLEELVLIFRREFYGACFYCGVQLMGRRQSRRHPGGMTSRTVDHVVPLSKMGSDSKPNKVSCCYRCNSVKKDKSIEEFRVECYGGPDVEFFFEYEIRRRGLKPEPQINVRGFLGVQNLESEPQIEEER